MDRDSPRSTMHVELNRFAEHMRVLSQLCTVVPLQEIVQRNNLGKSTRGLAAVTFDDAYVAVEGLLAGFPDTPVTVFATSGLNGPGQRFWWDRIEETHARVDQDTWRELESECALPSAYMEGHAEAGDPLRPIRQWILAEHAGRIPPALDTSLSRLEQRLGHVTTQRPMSWEELRRLAQSPLVDVGVHTVSHPVLPLLTPKEQEREIGGGYSQLKDHIPKTLPLLAFPYGLHTEETWDAARAAGMKACFTLGEIIVRRSPSFLFPRINANNGLKGLRLLARISGRLDRIVQNRRGLRSPYPDLPSATS